MLVLTRKTTEEIVIPGCDIKITVLNVHKDKVRLGIEAPSDVKVFRKEVLLRIQKEEEALQVAGSSASVG